MFRTKWPNNGTDLTSRQLFWINVNDLFVNCLFTHLSLNKFRGDIVQNTCRQSNEYWSKQAYSKIDMNSSRKCLLGDITSAWLELKCWSCITHWGRMTHICVGKLTIIGSDNGLSPGRRQAIIWTNTVILLIGPSGTNFSEILIEIIIFSFKKIRLKVSSAERRPFCLGINVLRNQNFAITVPADYLTPDSTRPSVAILLMIKFIKYSSKFHGNSVILHPLCRPYDVNVIQIATFSVNIPCIHFNNSEKK